MIQQLSPHIPDYELIDSGEGEKLERFGQYVVRRPEPQAIWRKSLGERAWRDADASFLRDNRSEERGEWRLKPEIPGIPSPGGGVTSASPHRPRGQRRNVDRPVHLRRRSAYH